MGLWKATKVVALKDMSTSEKEDGNFRMMQRQMGGKLLCMAEQCVLMRLGASLTKGLAWHAVVLDATLKDAEIYVALSKFRRTNSVLYVEKIVFVAI